MSSPPSPGLEVRRRPAITVIANYRMGEANSGAADGSPANTPAVDSAGGAPVGGLGSASSYSANTAFGLPAPAFAERLESGRI